MVDFEKDKEDVREFTELLISLPQEDRETAKKILIGMRLSAEARQSA